MASSKNLAIRLALLAGLVAVACAKGYGGGTGFNYQTYVQPQQQVYAQVIPGRVQYYTPGVGGVGVGGGLSGGGLSGGGGYGGGYGVGGGGINGLSGALGQSGGFLIGILIFRKNNYFVGFLCFVFWGFFVGIFAQNIKRLIFRKKPA